MKKLFSFLVLLLMAYSAMAQVVPEYEMIGAGSGTTGKLLVRVTLHGQRVSDEDFIRCAVHGVVFRGCTGNNSGSDQPAMAPVSKETEMQPFCKEFFAADGACQNYAVVLPGTYGTVKVKKGYNSSAKVEVNKTALRKALEQAGLVKSLTSGF